MNGASPASLVLDSAALARPTPASRELAARRESCLACKVRGRTICAAVPEAAIDRMALVKLPSRRLPAGAVIYAEQEHCAECFTVLEGWVALTAALEDGGRVVLDFALPGDYFGFQANPDAPRPQSAIAVTAVRLCPLPRGRMQPLVGTDAAVAKHLSHLLAMHEARAHDHLINNASREAHGRIAHLLIELYFRQRHRLPEIPDEVIDLPLTLALIGEAVGLTPVHVSRSLRRLREERVLRLNRGRLLIIDPEALIRASGVDDRPLADATIPC